MGSAEHGGVDVAHLAALHRSIQDQICLYSCRTVQALVPAASETVGTAASPFLLLVLLRASASRAGDDPFRPRTALRNTFHGLVLLSGVVDSCSLLDHPQGD